MVPPRCLTSSRVTDAIKSKTKRPQALTRGVAAAQGGTRQRPYPLRGNTGIARTGGGGGDTDSGESTESDSSSAVFDGLTSGGGGDDDDDDDGYDDDYDVSDAGVEVQRRRRQRRRRRLHFSGGSKRDLDAGGPGGGGRLRGSPRNSINAGKQAMELHEQVRLPTFDGIFFFFFSFCF